VVEPNGVLDDRHVETVAVRLGVGHGGSAYLNPVKATQPLRLIHAICEWCSSLTADLAHHMEVRPFPLVDTHNLPLAYTP